ncbi:acyl carrier protein [Allocatelliglobosispora scoriae]|uniref:Acyl carrier protein n=1 Tax=Allocatelliglobosispora scoriae TaxID=643052 RepID=A0A841BU27_9ACTN|nr:phosphopantetheine-binding protein [Allocatelliglobosispora scoriae]MBB5872597.1 acyl carrier protein [Allocatelliglobosispora scoriae]
MSTEVRQFILDAIEDMNYPMDDVDADTSLGSAGVALESLAVAELAVRVEDTYGVKFGDEEAEEISAMTIAELADAIVARRALSQA